MGRGVVEASWASQYPPWDSYPPPLLTRHSQGGTTPKGFGAEEVGRALHPFQQGLLDGDIGG